jgi:hypothetical protein
MIVDFHTHIFPEEMCRHREKYFPGEPAFRLLYESSGSRIAGGKDLIDAMDDGDISVSVVFGFPWKNPELFRRHNDYIMECVSKHPGRLVGFCCLDPFDDTAPDEAHRCLSSGLSGLGELAFYETGIEEPAIDRLEPLMEICRSGDSPALFHVNEPIGHPYPGKSPITLSQIYRLVTRFPHNKIVLAHWGGGIFFYRLLKKEVRERLANVYFDTAASPFLYEPSVYRHAVEIAGAEKILLGSDFPLLRPARYLKELEASGVTPEEKEMICGRNAVSLLGPRLRPEIRRAGAE